MKKKYLFTKDIEIKKIFMYICQITKYINNGNYGKKKHDAERNQKAKTNS